MIILRVDQVAKLLGVNRKTVYEAPTVGCRLLGTTDMEPPMSTYKVRRLDNTEQEDIESTGVGAAARAFAVINHDAQDIADGGMELVVRDPDTKTDYSVTVEAVVEWDAFVNGPHQEDKETTDG